MSLERRRRVLGHARKTGKFFGGHNIVDQRPAALTARKLHQGRGQCASTGESRGIWKSKSLAGT
eukprot:7329916-Pyramimonas_sp.AAC.1